MNNIKSGIVAYFDILGFSSFAKVQDDEAILRAAKLMQKNLLQIPNRIKKLPNMVPRYFRNLDWRIFADSILISQEIPPTEPEYFYWLAFFRVCKELMRLSFNDGLPLRGAISTGKFYIEKDCFVGKPIIDCHKLSSRTLWAGCVVAPKAQKELQKLWQTNMEQVCVKYNVPIKNKELLSCEAHTKSMFALKWFHVDHWRAPLDAALGIPKVIQKSFESHGKKISSQEVRLKMKNTETFLIFVDSLYANSNKKHKRNLL